MYDSSNGVSITKTYIYYEVLQSVKFYYGIPMTAKISPYRLGDQRCYLVEEGGSIPKRVLRITPSEHENEDIISELAWMNQIRNNTGVLTPQPVRGLNGQFIQRIQIPGTQEQYHCVLFDFCNGPTLSQCDPKQILKKFKQLGEITAKLHQDSIVHRSIEIPNKTVYNFENMIGEHAHFGLWHGAVGLTDDADAILTTTASVIQQRLEQFGKASSRFGLIHANLSLSNIVEVKDKFCVNNFEGCGHGWFLYDFAVSLQSVDTVRHPMDLFTAWSEGYRRHRKLSRAETTEVYTFIMLARLYFLCRKRNGAHHGENLENSYIAKTVDMANDYLARFG